MTEILETLNSQMALYLVFPLVVVYGLYLSVKLEWLQLRSLRESFRCLFHSGDGEEGSVSRFGAITAVLAGNFGTGNISGIAVALSMGGPGALVWMWIMVLFGSIIQYASSLLGVLYRTKSDSGEFVGGPMYYLKSAGLNKIAALFCCFTIFGAFTVGNMAQVNSMVLPLEAMQLHPTLGALLVGLVVGLVLIGGIERLSKFASFVVPFMALLYLGAAAWIIAAHLPLLGPTLQLMFQKAFEVESLLGGVAGATLFKAITVGFDRAIFATDAGTGIVPILQSGARTSHPVHDGIATLVTPLLVMIVCTATGLVLLMTGAWQISGLESTNMVTYAFTKGLGSEMGGMVVMIALLLFAFTTILAWGHCGEKALSYLCGERFTKWFRLAYLALIPVGSLLQVSLIWTLADLSISFMLIANMAGIIALTPVVLSSTKEHNSLAR